MMLYGSVFLINLNAVHFKFEDVEMLVRNGWPGKDRLLSSGKQ